MDITFILEIIGTIAFAFSGAFVAIEYKLDMFGILSAAVVTATGGGAIRDILLGNTPPLLFTNPIYFIVSVCIAFITAIIYKSLIQSRFKNHILGIIDLFDAIGLAVFTIVGMQTAITMGFDDNKFLVCFVGLVTAVGGGVLRDIFTCRQPIIMQKEIYATASVLGSIIYLILGEINFIPEYAAAGVSMAVMFSIRMWSLKNDVNLPFAENKKK